jgi:hypothetical protein
MGRPVLSTADLLHRGNFCPVIHTMVLGFVDSIVIVPQLGLPVCHGICPAYFEVEPSFSTLQEELGLEP